MRQRNIETQHRRVPLRKVTVLWDKTISTENRDSRPLPIIQQVSIPQIDETLKD